MTEVRALAIPEVLEIIPSRHGDQRGFFSEVYSAPTLREHGVDVPFVQDNHSFSAARGVLRGLHFQRPPFAQDKLVRVAKGSIYDVAVDIRHGSPTFGQWVGLVVSAEKWNQVFVPKGFAHGFVTLEPNCEVLYKASTPYAPQHEGAVRFDDPAIGIEWPVGPEQLILSEKDQAAGSLAEVQSGFVYGGGQ